MHAISNRKRCLLGSGAAALGLLAAAASAEQAVPAGAEEPSPPRPTAEERIRFTVAPIRWWGDLAFDYRMTGGDAVAGERTPILTGNLNGATYVWQPWFAQVLGSLGFVVQRSHFDDGTTTNSQGLTGGLDLSVFPTSRFPFRAFFNVSDSRSGGDITGADFRNTRFGVSQSYSPLNRPERYQVSYEESRLETERGTFLASPLGPDEVTDTVRTLRGTFFTSWQAHTFDVQGNLSENTREGEDDWTRLTAVTARHGYRPRASVNVDNLFSLTDTDLEQGGPFGDRSLSTRFTQLSSFATWRAQEGDWLYSPLHPLYVTGNLRAFDVTQASDGSTTDARSLNASLGINHELTPFLRLFSSTAAGHFTGSNRDGENTFSQSLGATYTPQPVPLGKYLYNWSLNGNGTLSTTTTEGLRSVLAAGANHGLTRSYPLGEQGNLTLNLAQGVSETVGSRQNPSTAVTHTAGLSWSATSEGGQQSFASASLSDSRSFGENETEFQIFNLQATRQGPVTRVSSWTGNLTYQASRSRTRFEPIDGALLDGGGTGWQQIYSANLSYFHGRAFGVRGLRYTALVTGSSQRLDTRAQGNVEARTEQINLSVENRLDYTIGRLDLRLSARVADIDGRTSWVVLFRVVRRFGAR